ncbi:MAG: hypothetical protein V1735_04980 [Nanoarchaeota archaeon]
MSEYLARVRRYIRFSRQEITDILLSLLVIAFAFGFDDHKETFEVSAWLGNFLTVLLIVAISFIAHQLIQKFVAIFAGYRSEFKAWGWGIILCLALTFVTKGNWIFVAAGGVFVYHLPFQRIGMFRYGLSTYYSGLVAVSGPLINLVLAIVFKLLFLGTQDPYLLLGMKVNLWMAFYSILPIPPLDGGTAFFGGRSTYFYWLGFVLAAIVLILVLKSLLAILLGTLLLSVLLWLVFFVFIEYGSWVKM